MEGGEDYGSMELEKEYERGVFTNTWKEVKILKNGVSSCGNC
jgi:hypothetical protein